MVRIKQAMNPPERYDIKKVEYNFGLAVHKVRKQKKLTLVDVEDMGGPTKGTVSAYEKGLYTKPSLEMVLKLCNALDIGIGDLVLMCHEDDFAWAGGYEDV